MHRAIRSLMLTAILVGSSSGLAAAKDFVFNPQAGLTASHRTNDPADITTAARVGYAFGGNLRFGSGKAYLAPGVYLQRENIQLTQKDGSPFGGEYQLYSNGGEMIASVTGTQASFQLPIEAGKEHWYFVRVHGPDGKSVAYLAPVWITGK